MATNWVFLAPCRRNAHTPSCLPIVSLGLPGPLPVNPLAIRSQDGPPCLLPISASFRNPSDPAPSVCAGGVPTNRGELPVSASLSAPPVLTGEDCTRGGSSRERGRTLPPIANERGCRTNGTSRRVDNCPRGIEPTQEESPSRRGGHRKRYRRPRRWKGEWPPGPSSAS